MVEYFKTYNLSKMLNDYKKEVLIKEDTKEIKEIQDNLDTLKKELNETVQTKLQDLKENIIINDDPLGIRIDMLDPKGDFMFFLGKSELNPSGERILKEFSAALVESDAKIAIEGHTDAVQYPTTKYTNWELSTERASSARKGLEVNGIPPNRIAMVAGYADTKPIIQSDPYDPRNRRISILILKPMIVKADTIKKSHE
jgi:chemotaxis protein MotB